MQELWRAHHGYPSLTLNPSCTPYESCRSLLLILNKYASAWQLSAWWALLDASCARTMGQDSYPALFILKHTHGRVPGCWWSVVYPRQVPISPAVKLAQFPPRQTHKHPSYSSESHVSFFLISAFINSLFPCAKGDSYLSSYRAVSD